MANVEEKKNELDDKKIFTSNAQRTTTVAKGETIIELKDVTIRFNKNNLKVDNLKEYFIRLVTKQLMFQEFIALKDINLDIKKGEAWGFLGTNGAGKSTLLKVVSRILKPASGTVKVSGTVAALIELGAGIDPQLTARENIFLNGTLLGYSKAFIESKFDDIVEFSELQDFLDSPVKNFSSGMKTRLAFSIATAVEPDILIADEILAVGDMRFKKKCAAKMTAMLEDAMQKVMDNYAGGISTHYQFNEKQLELAKEKIEQLQKLVWHISAHDMHELMFVYEVKERLTVALSVIAHLKDRKETRWHSFAENLDYPEKSKDWEIFVNSKMVDGELKMIHRDLVNLCQVPAGNMACSVSPSPEATSNGLMFQGKGNVYEHSDK